MLRTSFVIALVLAALAVATSAGAMSFTRMRLTDNTTDETLCTVERSLAIGPGNRIHVAYCSRDERGGEDSELWYATADAQTDIAFPGRPQALRIIALASPARGAVRFRFETAMEASVWSAVYDVRGRLLHRAALGSRPPGTHDGVWDGRERTNARVAAGVYVLQLMTPQAVATRKVVIAR